MEVQIQELEQQVQDRLNEQLEHWFKADGRDENSCGLETDLYDALSCLFLVQKDNDWSGNYDSEPDKYRYPLELIKAYAEHFGYEIDTDRGYHYRCILAGQRSYAFLSSLIQPYIENRRSK